MTRRSEFPSLTEADIKKATADALVRIAEQRKDDADQRQLKGKYAPPEGVCRSGVYVPLEFSREDAWKLQPCKGRVVPSIAFPTSNVIGGPPRQAYIDHWYCEGCGLMYHAPPKDKL